VHRQLGIITSASLFSAMLSQSASGISFAMQGGQLYHIAIAHLNRELSDNALE
jgi:hypothetical protein